VYEVILP